jgi:hypothetical protein
LSLLYVRLSSTSLWEGSYSPSATSAIAGGRPSPGLRGYRNRGVWFLRRESLRGNGRRGVTLVCHFKSTATLFNFGLSVCRPHSVSSIVRRYLSTVWPSTDYSTHRLQFGADCWLSARCNRRTCRAISLAWNALARPCQAHVARLAFFSNCWELVGGAALLSICVQTIRNRDPNQVAVQLVGCGAFWM